jgi:hypothetical protein
MIEHLRQRVIKALAAYDRGMLITCGAAGPQASFTAYESVDTTVYVLLPRSSDHLFNLEQHPEVVMMTDFWELRGTGQLLTQRPERASASPKRVQHDWEVWLEIRPVRLQLLGGDGTTRVETIDC